MAEQNQADGDSNKARDGQKGDLRFVVAVILGILIPYLILIGVAIWHPYLSERVKFGTENGLSIAILIAVIAQVVINRKQWQAMQDGLERTDRVIEKTEGQLRLMRSQTKSVSFQAEMSRDQRDLMEGQLRALELGEAPYFGLVGINTRGIGANVSPILKLSFQNGGKTPAWHFNALVCLAIGDSPDSKDHWFISPDAQKISETFFASGEKKAILYTKTDLVFTISQFEALRDKDVFLYLIVTATFTDFRGRLCPSQTFICGFDMASEAFGDYQIT